MLAAGIFPESGIGYGVIKMPFEKYPSRPKFTVEEAEEFLSKRNEFIYGDLSGKPNTIFIGAGPKWRKRPPCKSCNPLFFGRIRELGDMDLDSKKIRKQLQSDLPEILKRFPEESGITIPTPQSIGRHMRDHGYDEPVPEVKSATIARKVCNAALSPSIETTDAETEGEDVSIDGLNSVQELFKTAQALCEREEYILTRHFEEELTQDDIRVISEKRQAIKAYELGRVEYQDNEKQKQVAVLNAIAVNMQKMEYEMEEGSRVRQLNEAILKLVEMEEESENNN